MLAAIRVRGDVNLRKGIRDTLKMLRLTRVNHCVVVGKTPTYEGMLKKVRYYVTWGEISPEILEKLVSKRGRLAGDKKVEAGEAKKAAKLIEKESIKSAGIKPVFRLSPPSQGYKAIRKMYPKGALGYRGDKINDLIKKMV